MKILGRTLLIAISICLVGGIFVYADGAMQPLEHSTSVSGIVEAPPAKVFSLITNIAGGPSWRHSLQSVQVLPVENGRDHWIEDLGHGQTMNFLATKTEPVDPSGNARREVLLDEPNATYGGTWTYELSPGASPNQTKLRIPETGFIKPPVYRFMMAHIFGMTRNLDQYMTDIQAAAARN